jgi:hypothetical protein
MPEPTNFSAGPSGAPNPAGDPLFRGERREKSFQAAAVGIAVVVVAIVVVVLLVLGRHGATPAGGAGYAPNLVVSDLHLSQSESLSGGRSTYVDGHVANHGDKTVTGATVEAQFASDGGQTQVLSAPVSVIRTRVPYVDTEPLSAAPLGPGAQADFRLIFEGVGDSWNQQMPGLRITQVSTR